MPSQWYRQSSGNEAGPFTFEDLVEQLRSESLTGEDLVRRAEQQKWQRADEVVGLMRAARVSSAPPRPKRKLEHEKRAAHPRPDTETLDAEPQKWWRVPLTREQVIHRALPASVLIIACAFGLGWWLTRPPHPPEIPAARMEVVIPSRLEQMRPRAPRTPTIAGLTDSHPVPIPGLENVLWATGPTLSGDLTTIVYVTFRGPETQDDLFIAERESTGEPFRRPVPIGTCAGPDKEAYPSISQDGLELIYSKLGSPNRLMYSSRSKRGEEFGPPMPLKIEGEDFSELNVDGCQFLSSTRIRFAAGDTSFTQRTQWVAERTGTGGAFRIAGTLPFANPWPRFFVTSGQQRAYYPSEDGIFLTALETTIGEFVIPERLLPASEMGPNPARFDSPIWISSQEDIAVFCSAGLESPDSNDNRIWMIRLTGQVDR